MKKRSFFSYKIIAFIAILLFVAFIPIKAEAASKKNISGAAININNTTYTYTGSAIRPTVTVRYRGVLLGKDRDYTVAYRNNINAGTATVTITGKGNYTGTKKQTFTISKKNISTITDITYSTHYTYTGSTIKPAVTIKYGNKTLKKNTDYTVSYKDNINAGKGKIIIKGKGNYCGTKTGILFISSRPIDTDFFLTTLTYPWKGMAVNSFKAKSSDGTFSIKNNKTTAMYLATDKNHSIYIPKGATNFSSIKLKQLTNLDTNATLIKDTDYTVTYSYYKDKCILTISGLGNYTGTKIINCIAK